MGRQEQMMEKIEALKDKPEYIRNMGIVAHIDHGKTTLSDNLLCNAGMISKDTAGKQLALDFHEDEQARGITINAANVSMVHNYEGNDYLINMIDTPGHVDFGGDVTRAMRAVDGVIVVTCAVEGVMPQTKTVIGQALKERVSLLKGLKESIVRQLAEKMTLTPGAEELIEILKLLNYKIAIISGGFNIFTNTLKKKLGIEYTFSNKLVIEDGILTGELEEPIIDAEYCRKSKL